VTALDPTASAVTIAANGQTLTVPVVVTPVGVAPTLSGTALTVNQPLMVTLPAPYRFGAGAVVNIGENAGVTLGFSADSSTLTVLPLPGSSGTLTLDSVAPSYAPTLRFSLPAPDSVRVDSLLTAVPGTADPATAPALPVPAAGQATGFFDLPDFAATIDHFYRLDIVEAGDYTITVDWTLGSDIDLALCDPATCADPSLWDYTAATSNQPESATFTLAAGTYYVIAEDFAEDANGAVISLSVAH
jgi:hypothetical protein